MKHGRRDEARTMLADIYGWFTQGFDTADSKTPRRCSTSYRANALREVGVV
jgi:hypothetical protein